MIVNELFLFLIGLGFGLISRLFFVAISSLERAINLKAITIIFDVIFSGLMVSAFCLILFIFCDGVFLPYILIAAIIGFITTSAIL